METQIMAVNKLIGEKISAIRAFKKVELEDLAKKAGLSVKQLNLIESGKSIPSLGVLIRITRALGTRIGTILDDTVKEGPAITGVGEKIYSHEIENFLYQMPQIEMVEVAGIADEKYGEIVGAFIKLKNGQSLTQEEVQEFCRGKISRIKIPKHVIFVGDFPKTASGKIQKYKLRQMGLEYAQRLNS